MPEQTRATRRGGRDHDRSLLLRAAAVVAGAGLALAGCGTVMPGAVVGDRATGCGLRQHPGVGPGVTDDTVKVVFVGVDLKAHQKLTGFKTADAGDPEAPGQGARGTGSTPTAASPGASWTPSSASTRRRTTRRPPRSSCATRSPRTTRRSRSC